MKRVAIIGAGVSGLAAAWTLRQAGVDDVVVFEKSRGVSGRAATRRRDGVHYDHGANYVRADAPEVAHLIQQVLPTDELADIGRDVWTFDAAGRLAPGDHAANGLPRWTYRSGISRLGKHLYEASGAALRTEVRVRCIAAVEGGWRLVGTAEQDLGTFGRVVVTPPAPQTADLLAESRMEEGLRRRLEAAFRAVTYRTQVTIVLAYTTPLPRPGDFYALVNTDGRHDVAWVGFEEDKPGHVPSGGSLLVVQMAPGWSTAHYEMPVEAAAPAVAAKVGALLRTEADHFAWADRQGWRYALPEGRVDAEALAQGRPRGLYFCGDAVAGKGRVGLALQSGLEAGRRVRDDLASIR